MPSSRRNRVRTPVKRPPKKGSIVANPALPATAPSARPPTSKTIDRRRELRAVIRPTPQILSCLVTAKKKTHNDPGDLEDGEQA
jgi:hypothetical protein